MHLKYWYFSTVVDKSEVQRIYELKNYAYIQSEYIKGINMGHHIKIKKMNVASNVESAKWSFPQILSL